MKMTKFKSFKPFQSFQQVRPTIVVDGNFDCRPGLVVADQKRARNGQKTDHPIAGYPSDGEIDDNFLVPVNDRVKIAAIVTGRFGDAGDRSVKRIESKRNSQSQAEPKRFPMQRK